jgi:anaerobic ribonucleoside-triphosphate reductase activating protein
MTTAELRIAAFIPRSRANGPGLRSVLWVQGCPLRCPGCFNPDFLLFEGGQVGTVARVADWILSDPDTEGVSFSGGEPFSQAAPLAELAERVRAAGKGVLIFTGCTAASLISHTDIGTRRLLAAADLLVAGPYRRELPSRHPLLASANQELVFLAERYRGLDLGPRRTEIRIAGDGAVIVTGFPSAEASSPPSCPSPTRGEGSSGRASSPAQASFRAPFKGGASL